MRGRLSGDNVLEDDTLHGGVSVKLRDCELEGLGRPNSSAIVKSLPVADAFLSSEAGCLDPLPNDGNLSISKLLRSLSIFLSLCSAKSMGSVPPEKGSDVSGTDI